ncbi:MAG: flagellar export chaperone FliS, partial [Thermoleophilia bacterium]|nr:flagellar export chaperone FliS [Thermoleophilia bacterium]
MSHIGHDAYRVNAVETASPEQLTLMCYDGALRFMRRAAKALEDGDLAGANNATGRAQAIINELNVTLDMERGGEIARNLR